MFFGAAHLSNFDHAAKTKTGPQAARTLLHALSTEHRSEGMLGNEIRRMQRARPSVSIEGNLGARK